MTEPLNPDSEAPSVDSAPAPDPAPVPEGEAPAVAATVAPADSATSTGRVRRAALLGLRVAGGTVGLVAALATVVAVGLLPLPTRTIAAPGVVVTPAPASQQRVCPGGLLRLGDTTGADAGIPAAVGSPSVRTGSVSGELVSTPLAGGDANNGGSLSAPRVLEVPGATGATLSGAQSQIAGAPGFVGLAEAACGEPSGSSWLVGGSTAVGRTTLLTLSNPTAVDATVTLQLFGEKGPVAAPGMSGILVKSGGQRVLSLAGFAPNLVSPVVHVQSRGGQVVASLQQSIVRVLDPGGVDLIGAAADPSLAQYIPGARILDAIAVNNSLALADYQDAAPIVRVAVPGSVDASVTVSVVPEDPSVAGTSFQLTIPAGKVVDTPLDAGVGTDSATGVALADGRYAVTVTADQPVVAAVRLTTATAPAAAGAAAGTGGATTAPTTDFAWFSAAPALTGDTLLTVAAGDAPVVSVINPTPTAITLTMRAQSGADITLTVPAGGVSAAQVVPSTSYLLVGATGLHVAVSDASSGRLAGYVIASARPVSGDITIHP